MAISRTTALADARAQAASAREVRPDVGSRALRAAKQRPARPDRQPGLKRANFGDRLGLPTLLLLPQILILLFFFFIPSGRALLQSFLLSDPFGNVAHFIWLDNFKALLSSAQYRQSVGVTVWFTLAQNAITLL